jgi:twitching motility protein PilT
LIRTGSCDASYSVADKALSRQYFQPARQLFHRHAQAQHGDSLPGKLEAAGNFSPGPKEKTGLVLVTGATGSGKSTTLAAVLNEINEPNRSTSSRWRTRWNLCIRTKRPPSTSGKWAAISAPSPRPARRLAPGAQGGAGRRNARPRNGEIGLSAAETGHLVLSTLHTIDAGQTINRILGMFEPEEQEQIRIRLSDTLRWVISQRLAPQIGGGRHALLEIMGANLRTKETIRSRRKRRQELLRNHRGQPHFRLAHF